MVAQETLQRNSEVSRNRNAIDGLLQVCGITYLLSEQYDAVGCAGVLHTGSVYVDDLGGSYLRYRMVLHQTDREEDVF